MVKKTHKSDLNSVLYIDDEDVNVFMFDMLFKDTFALETAMSGYDGLQILKSHPEIGIVISDMKMPEMNGLEFISKAQQDFDYISYYILTGYDINDSIQQALNSGIIKGYMQKPYDYETLLNAIGVNPG